MFVLIVIALVYWIVSAILVLFADMMQHMMSLDRPSNLRLFGLALIAPFIAPFVLIGLLLND